MLRGAARPDRGRMPHPQRGTFAMNTLPRFDTQEVFNQ
jgi:hypothetical protein